MFIDLTNGSGGSLSEEQIKELDEVKIISDTPTADDFKDENGNQIYYIVVDSRDNSYWILENDTPVELTLEETKQLLAELNLDYVSKTKDDEIESKKTFLDIDGKSYAVIDPTSKSITANRFFERPIGGKTIIDNTLYPLTGLEGAIIDGTYPNHAQFFNPELDFSVEVYDEENDEWKRLKEVNRHSTYAWYQLIRGYNYPAIHVSNKEYNKVRIWYSPGKYIWVDMLYMYYSSQNNYLKNFKIYVVDINGDTLLWEDLSDAAPIKGWPSHAVMKLKDKLLLNRNNTTRDTVYIKMIIEFEIDWQNDNNVYFHKLAVYGGYPFTLSAPNHFVDPYNRTRFFPSLKAGANVGFRSGSELEIESVDETCEIRMYQDGESSNYVQLQNYNGNFVLLLDGNKKIEVNDYRVDFYNYIEFHDNVYFPIGKAIRFENSNGDTSAQIYYTTTYTLVVDSGTTAFSRSGNTYFEVRPSQNTSYVKTCIVGSSELTFKEDNTYDGTDIGSIYAQNQSLNIRTKNSEPIFLQITHIEQDDDGNDITIEDNTIYMDTNSVTITDETKSLLQGSSLIYSNKTQEIDSDYSLILSDPAYQSSHIRANSSGGSFNIELICDNYDLNAMAFVFDVSGSFSDNPVTLVRQNDGDTINGVASDFQLNESWSKYTIMLLNKDDDGNNHWGVYKG